MVFAFQPLGQLDYDEDQEMIIAADLLAVEV